MNTLERKAAFDGVINVLKDGGRLEAQQFAELIDLEIHVRDALLVEIGNDVSLTKAFIDHWESDVVHQATSMDAYHKSVLLTFMAVLMANANNVPMAKALISHASDLAGKGPNSLLQLLATAVATGAPDELFVGMSANIGKSAEDILSTAPSTPADEPAFDPTDTAIRGPRSLCPRLDDITGIKDFGLQPRTAFIVVDANRRVTQVEVREGHTLELDEPTLSALAKKAVQGGVVAVFAQDPGVEIVEDLHDMFIARGAHLLDAITVDGRRWRSLLCYDAYCCPAEGKEY